MSQRQIEGTLFTQTTYMDLPTCLLVSMALFIQRYELHALTFVTRGKLKLLSAAHTIRMQLPNLPIFWRLWRISSCTSMLCHHTLNVCHAAQKASVHAGFIPAFDCMKWVLS